MNAETAKESSEESKKCATNKAYQTTIFEMNVQDDKSVKDMVDFVVKEYGRLDYAVNAAGVSTDCPLKALYIHTLLMIVTFSALKVDNGIHAPIAEVDIENYDRIMNINARGNLICVRAQVAAMQKQEPKTWTSRNGTRDIGRGVIINLASANSFVGLPGKGCYTISKHAFMAVTKMAGESSRLTVFIRWGTQRAKSQVFQDLIMPLRGFESTQCARPGCAPLSSMSSWRRTHRSRA